MTTSVYERTDGSGATLIGSWKPISSRHTVPSRLAISQPQAGELQVRNPVDQDVYSVRLDGKEYSYTGPRILPGITITVQAADKQSLQATYFRNHQPIAKSTMSLSADGRTLTISSKSPDSTDEPSSVTVYTKQ